MRPALVTQIPLMGWAAALAGLTLIVVLVGFHYHWPFWSYALFAVPALAAVYYLNEYRKLPYEPFHFGAPPPAPSPPGTTVGAAAADEPFDDPVVEADRLQTEAAQEEGAPSKGPSDPGEPPA